MLRRHWLLNKIGEWINPATEDKQNDIIVALSGLLNPKVKLYDAANSTEIPLSVDEEFVGEWVDASKYSAAIISVVTDQDSADGGLRFESSKNGVDFLHSHNFSPRINTPDGHHIPTTLDCDWYRIKYKNGSTGQGVFKLTSVLFRNPPEECHVHPMDYEFGDDHSASINRAVITAKNPAGVPGNIDRTFGGSLKVSLEEVETVILEILNIYPTGTPANALLTLTNADTSYAVPPSAPSGSYQITICNTSDVTIFIGYEDTNENGIPMEPGDIVSKDLGSGQQLYVYCASAGKTATYTTKLVN